jgi:hypothetical protein
MEMIELVNSLSSLIIETKSDNKKGFAEMKFEPVQNKLNILGPVTRAADCRVLLQKVLRQQILLQSLKMRHGLPYYEFPCGPDSASNHKDKTSERIEQIRARMSSFRMKFSLKPDYMQWVLHLLHQMFLSQQITGSF